MVGAVFCSYLKAKREMQPNAPKVLGGPEKIPATQKTKYVPRFSLRVRYTAAVATNFDLLFGGTR